MERMKLEFNEGYYSIIDETDNNTILCLADLESDYENNEGLSRLLIEVVKDYNNNIFLSEIIKKIRSSFCCTINDKISIIEAIYNWEEISNH